MEYTEIFLYVLKYYFGMYIVSTVLLFSGINPLIIQIFQIIFYTIGIIGISLTIYYKYKNSKLKDSIKKLKNKK